MFFLQDTGKLLLNVVTLMENTMLKGCAKSVIITKERGVDSLRNAVIQISTTMLEDFARGAIYLSTTIKGKTSLHNHLN